MKVAICVATCGRPASLARLLERLGEIDRTALAPADAFLVLVDNRPSGEAGAVCARYRAALPLPLVFAEEPVPGISFARNRALAVAFAHGADFVAFLDDDDRPRRDWLVHLLAAQRASEAEIVFGFWELPPGVVVGGLLGACKFFRPPNAGGVSRYGLPQWAGTYNVLLARTLVERLAPDGVAFAPELALIGGSDTDLFIRAVRLGAVVATAPDSLVERGWDPARCTWRGVLKRAFRNGVSHATMERRHLPRGLFQRRQSKGLLAAGKAYARVLALPLILLRGRGKRTADLLVDAARRTGEVWAYFGGGFRYYAAAPPAPPSPLGPVAAAPRLEPAARSARRPR